MDAQARADEAALAEVEGKSAEAARELAAEASQKLFPVSVFISRKTQRLYVRQNYVPVYEAPVTIRDPDAPIGSYVFTALGPDTNGAMRWNVVSMYKEGGSESQQQQKGTNPSIAAHKLPRPTSLVPGLP